MYDAVVISMNKSAKNIGLAGVLSIATLIRFPLLNTFPPIGIPGILPRIITALLSIVSIFLLIKIINIDSKNERLGLVTGSVMALMPWHIEQSRIYSSPMIMLVSLLLTYLGILHKSILVKICAIGLCGISVYLFFMPTWGGSWNEVSFDIREILKNIFHLFSVQFWFIQNDSSWIGGIRERGVMLFSMLPVFIFGLVISIRTIQLKHLYFILSMIGVILVSALNPFFPEGQLMFLLVPMAAVIFAIGIDKIFSFLTKINILTKVIIILYLLFVTYDYLVYYHFYTHHYTQRIQNSVPYEERNF